MRDSLSNLAASLGAGKDKAAGDSFMLVDLDRAEIEAMVRGDWLTRKVVDIVPCDMVREWRAWSGQRADVARIEAAERRLGQPRRSIQKRRTAVRPNPPNRLSFSPARRYGTSASTRLGKRYESLIQRIKPSSSSDYSGRRRLKPRSRAWNEPRGRSWPHPSPPFTPESIAAIDSIKAFLSDNELAQARRLETVYFSPMFKTAGGTSIPGLRSYASYFCLYLRRFDNSYYEDLLKGFLDAVYDGQPEANFGGVTWPWFRVTTPDGDRYYPLYFHGNLKAWSDRMIVVATELATTMAWFDKGKFRITDR